MAAIRACTVRIRGSRPCPSQRDHIEAASHLAVCDHELEFTLGLDLLITALELDLQPR